jgi:hypothetical protein
MARAQDKTPTAKIFENIIFLEEVFGDRPEPDIPKLPVLEMAQCFDLESSGPSRASRRRSKVWPLWK